MDEKMCLYCGEMIKAQAIKCRYCQSEQDRSPRLDKWQRASRSLNSFGNVCIYLFTIPILAFVFFGLPGLAIGGIIGILGAAGAVAKGNG